MGGPFRPPLVDRLPNECSELVGIELVDCGEDWVLDCGEFGSCRKLLFTGDDWFDFDEPVPLCVWPFEEQ